MKLSENVEVESNEAKASNSRASRLARYSTAAAGVAAVSSIEIDAATITRDLGISVEAPGVLDVSEMAGAVAGTFEIAIYNNSFGSNNGNGSQAYLYKFFGKGASIGPTTTGGSWTSGGSMGSSFSSFSQAFLGFRVPTGSSSYKYGYIQMDGSSSAKTFRYWGYESVANTAVITQAGLGSSAVPDTGPGFVGIALLGAGAAGMRLLRKLRAGK